jgi:beta-glucosidase-like glycosyl hydrolase
MKEAEARAILGRLFVLRLPQSWDEIDLKRFPIANYIVFKDCLEPSLEASKSRLESARSHLESSGIDPLFMIDEEGGRVTQMSGLFQSAPSPRAISRALTPEMAGEVYAHVSAHLAHIGIDLNFFPCVDVNTEPLNPIIGTRSYGDIPEQVSVYAREAIGASRRFVASVAKHFPGHGMTRADSHTELPIVTASHTRMDYVHIHPFRDAIAAGADGIMVGHCAYLAFQTDNLPASLSRQVVTEQLRERLRYNGLVFTDSLDMKAVTGKVTGPHAGLLAIEAGCDMVLYTEYSDRFERSFEALLDALLMGRLEIERLQVSDDRRAKVAERLKLLRHFPSIPHEDTYLPLLSKVDAVSVEIKDVANRLPLDCKDAILLSTSRSIAENLRTYVPNIIEDPDTVDAAGKVLIIWVTEPLHVKRAFGNLQNLVEKVGTSVLVTSYPALLDLLPQCDATIITHDTSPRAEEQILKRLCKQPA